MKKPLRLLLTLIIIASFSLSTIPQTFSLSLDKKHVIRARCSYGFSLSLNDTLSKLGSALTQIVPDISQKTGGQFLYLGSLPEWLNYFLSASAGFNFAIENGFTIRAILDNRAFQPKTSTKLYLEIGRTGWQYLGVYEPDGFLAFKAWVNASFNMPLFTEEGAIKGFSLYRYDQKFEFGRLFQTGLNVEYPPSDWFHQCDSFRVPINVLFPPFEDGYSRREYPFPAMDEDYGGWLPFIYEAEVLKSIGYPKKPLYGFGFGVAPDLRINGTLSGAIDGPGVHTTFTITNSSALDFTIPETNKIADLVAVSVHNLTYTYKPKITLHIFAWAFAIDPREYFSETLNAHYFINYMEIGSIPIDIPVQKYYDDEEYLIYIPAVWMDKYPFTLDNVRVAQMTSIAVSAVLIVWTRRLRR